MTTEDLTREVAFKLSAAHLLVVWDVLSNKLPGSSFGETLSDEERRAMCALQDLCERFLQANGLASRPKPEWDRLLQSARARVRSIPIDFEGTGDRS
jgi:hypothetical protein